MIEEPAFSLELLVPLAAINRAGQRSGAKRRMGPASGPRRECRLDQTHDIVEDLAVFLRAEFVGKL